jgi:hypothetical protein
MNLLVSEMHTSFTRQVSNFYQPTSKLTLYQRGIISMGITVYTKLPSFIKNASDNRKTFKTHLNNFLWSNLFYRLEEYFNYSAT